jgi:hypothetical protein
MVRAGILVCSSIRISWLLFGTPCKSKKSPTLIFFYFFNGNTGIIIYPKAASYRYLFASIIKNAWIVAKGPKFRPQNTKGAEKNCVGPEKSGAEYLPDLSKKGRKGAELFSSLKQLNFLQKTDFSTALLNFP